MAQRILYTSVMVFATLFTVTLCAWLMLVATIGKMR